MRKIIYFGILVIGFFISGCETNHNFMDVDNSNAKDDLKNMIGSGNLPKIDTKNIVPDSLSGKRNEAKGYANKYYEDNMHEYVDIAKQGLSGAKENLKGYYNSGVDQLNGIITDSISGIITDSISGMISGELNKIKVK